MQDRVGYKMEWKGYRMARPGKNIGAMASRIAEGAKAPRVIFQMSLLLAGEEGRRSIYPQCGNPVQRGRSSQKRPSRRPPI
eukprot:1157651-Pelagomonas_calceolata.AAC.4